MQTVVQEVWVGPEVTLCEKDLTFTGKGKKVRKYIFQTSITQQTAREHFKL